MITLTQRISSEVNKVIKISVSEIENETKGIKKKSKGDRESGAWKGKELKELRKRMTVAKYPRVNIQFSRFLIFIRFAVEPDKEKAWPGVTKRQYCGASTLATRHVHLL